MTKYRKIGADVDAFQMVRDVYHDAERWPEWLKPRYGQEIWHEFVSKDLTFQDQEFQRHYVRPGDWIVREFDGALRLMRAAEFASTYVEVAEECK